MRNSISRNGVRMRSGARDGAEVELAHLLVGGEGRCIDHEVDRLGDPGRIDGEGPFPGRAQCVHLFNGPRWSRMPHRVE
jgi:hypothetical protein